MKTLITGSRGFIGEKLTLSLQAAGVEILNPTINVTDRSAVVHFVSSHQIDCIIHLASITDVALCENNPIKAWDTNFEGTKHILDAITEHSPASHLIFSSSSMVYDIPKKGESNYFDELKLDENSKLRAQNVYAETKLKSEELVKEYSYKHGLRSTIVRPFTHTHKSQANRFLSRLYVQLTDHNKKLPFPFPKNNLDIFRDIGAAEDMVEALVSLTKLIPPAGETHLYNISSGHAKNLMSLTKKLAEHFETTLEFYIDKNIPETSEPKFICGVNKKLTEATGWTPKFASESEFLKYFLS